MEILNLLYIFLFTIFLLSIFIRQSERNYSRNLYYLNVSLLVLFIVMIILRYTIEVFFILGIKNNKINLVQIYITPIYGAFLARHIILNLDYFNSPIKSKLITYAYTFTQKLFMYFPNMKLLLKKILFK